MVIRNKRSHMKIWNLFLLSLIAYLTFNESLADKTLKAYIRYRRADY